MSSRLAYWSVHVCLNLTRHIQRVQILFHLSIFLLPIFLAFTMASKEATVYIIDLGASMGEKHHGREQTDLEWAMEYVWDKITTTVSACVVLALVVQIEVDLLLIQVATGRKTALMSVIGVRTDGECQDI